MDHPEARQILTTFHNATYGGHFGGTKTTTNVLKSGYFLPSFSKDINSLIKACDRCQKVGNISMRQEMSLTNILKIERFDV